MIILLMGVSGTGKTAVGEQLATRLGWVFIDGDDLHPQANIDKMAAGVPLDDGDRGPWLERIRAAIDNLEASGESAIIACSALKHSYRRLLFEGTRSCRLVHLSGRSLLIADRLRQRQNHFFDPALLDSQLATLEEPHDALVVSIDADPDSVATTIIRGLGLEGGLSEDQGKQ